MTEQELLTAFTDILRNILLDDTIVLTKDTRRADVPNWNSFNYINFIVAVEVAIWREIQGGRHRII